MEKSDGIKVLTKEKAEEAQKIADDVAKEVPPFLGTKPVKLPQIPGRRNGKRGTLVPVQMFLPPGVSRFFIERLDGSHIRFIITTDEVERLAEKAEKMMTDTQMKDGKATKN